MDEDIFITKVLGDILIEKITISHLDAKLPGELKERMLSNYAYGFNKIIVDFSRSYYLDSSLIGALLGVYKRLRERGGEMLLVIPEGQILTSFNYTGLHKVFGIFPSLRDALDYFSTQVTE